MVKYREYKHPEKSQYTNTVLYNQNNHTLYGHRKEISIYHCKMCDSTSQVRHTKHNLILTLKQHNFLS